MALRWVDIDEAINLALKAKTIKVPVDRGLIVTISTPHVRIGKKDALQILDQIRDAGGPKAQVLLQDASALTLIEHDIEE